MVDQVTTGTENNTGITVPPPAPVPQTPTTPPSLSAKKAFEANTQGQPKKEAKSEKPSLFAGLNPLQQLFAMIFMMFAQMMNPAAVQAAGLEKTFTKILGMDNFDQYESWHKDMESKNWNWKETQDFSKFNFEEAKQFAIKNDNLTFGERQKSVMSVMGDAAKTAGVQQEFLAGLWGVESSFGKNRLSGSGCLGDFQFTKGTFNQVMKEHGDVIADRLREQGEAKLAARIEKGGNLLELRDDPKVATYAAAFYAKDVAKGLKVDAQDQKNWGIIYAGYNIGPKNADKLDGSLANRDNVKSALGSVASWNPKFFQNGASGLEALGNYQKEIEGNLKKFLNIANADKPEPTSVAKNDGAGVEGKPLKPEFDAANKTDKGDKPASTVAIADNKPVVPADTPKPSV